MTSFDSRTTLSMLIRLTCLPFLHEEGASKSLSVQTGIGVIAPRHVVTTSARTFWEPSLGYDFSFQKAHAWSFTEEIQSMRRNQIQMKDLEKKRPIGTPFQMGRVGSATRAHYAAVFRKTWRFRNIYVGISRSTTTLMADIKAVVIHVQVNSNRFTFG